MSGQDRIRWDDRYADRAPEADVPGPPTDFASYAAAFPVTGTALDLACGQGVGSVWLAGRGLQVWGVDVSVVAIEQARALAARYGVTERCQFDVADLDDGLPPGPPVDVMVCHRFRDRRLDHAIRERLAPGGLLALSALSEVGAAPGRFRVAAGELPAAFVDLQVIADGERDGVAWILARRSVVVR